MHREPPVRSRIGSGRILNCDMWDFRPEVEKIDSDRSDYNFRPNQQRENREMRDRDAAPERRDRRSMRRDFLDKFSDKKYSSNNDRHRTYSEKEIEEPEWFSSGPTSQHDTIELKGFEDADEKGPKGKKQSPNRRRGRKFRTSASEKEAETPKGRSTPSSVENPPSAPTRSPVLEKSDKVEKEKEKVKEKEKSDGVPAGEPSEEQSKDEQGADFNLDEFLKSDTFPGVHGLLSVSFLKSKLILQDCK